MARIWIVAAVSLLASATQAQLSPMSSIEPAIVRGPSATPPAAATTPAPGTSTAAMVRATDRAAAPIDPLAPGTPNAAASKAHLQPHP